METLNKIKGFTIFNSVTGEHLAILPLTVPIGSTVEAYENEGISVRWAWGELNSEVAQ